MCKKIHDIDICYGDGGIEIIYDSTIESEAYKLDVGATVNTGWGRTFYGTVLREDIALTVSSF